MNITEDYCSYEVAKLLKEKGFDEQCRTFYKCWPVNPVLYKCDNTQVFDYCTNSSLSAYNYIGEEMNIAAPTHQMAMGWLREVYHIHIGINPISGKGYNATIYDVADFDDCGIISDTEFFFHPEEAIEVALKYCLENLV